VIARLRSVIRCAALVAFAGFRLVFAFAPRSSCAVDLCYAIIRSFYSVAVLLRALLPFSRSRCSLPLLPRALPFGAVLMRNVVIVPFRLPLPHVA